MKTLFILLLLFCTGCSTFDMHRVGSKVTVTNDVFPDITNDKEYTKGVGTQYRILVNGSVVWQFIYIF
jgi:hypothetical protein